MLLKGRAALITGGTQGVGGAMACAIAQAGADVLLQGLTINDHARQTQKKCRSFGVNSEIVLSDLSVNTMAAVDSVFRAAIAWNPKIDSLVNNAGTYIDKPFLEMDYATYEKTMHLNVTAAYFLTQRFARYWIEQKIEGRVLFTGSINGQLAENDHSAYDTSKGAVWMMVRSLCVALAPHGIRVNSVAPGLVRTPLTNRVLDKDADALAWMKLHTPNGEVPEADVCGGPAVFLLSDAARHVHGQTLLVDGGMSSWQQPDLPDFLRGKLGSG